MAKKYTKSYSNYILRRNPSPTKNGYVYENDLRTTNEKYNNVDGSMITSTDGGFTFIVNTTPDDSKIFNTNTENKKTYTLGDLNITEKDLKTLYNSENNLKIKNKLYVDLNQYYTNLSDYCYFGSSNVMLQSAISDIILNFPAGLNLTNTNNLIISGNTLTMSLIEDIVNGYVENNFLIDLFDYYQEERLLLKYNLRTMVTSYLDYEIVTDNDDLVGNVLGFTGYTTANTSQITFLLDNIEYIGQKLIIRPKKEKRDSFFENLDDFQSLLLNQYSVPKYRSNFIIPIESENGVTFEYKSFIWPTKDGYNIDINTASYTLFATELIEATNYIDEMYNDNLYRMLTHDSIKNFDSSYSQYVDSEEFEDIIFGGSKVEKILRLYGRSFDELKKYIEGISYVNSITYNGLNNLPKEYITSKLDTSGWDVFSLLNYMNENTLTNTKYPGSTKKYTTSEVNDLLMRNLIINSPYIFRSKGTRKSIRKLFGILGIDETWYEINEYIQTVDNFITGSTLEEFARLNYPIYPEELSISDGKEEYYYSFNPSLFDNTNIGIFVKCPICGSEDYIVSGGTDNVGICLNNTGHTFNITGNTIGYPRPCNNTNDYYFQQKGNWYRETGGNHTNFSGTTSYVKEIKYGNNPHIGDGYYDNGYDYINQFEQIFKRFVRNAGNSSEFDISEYINKGFTLLNKKNVNNLKINNGLLNEDKLTLNLKNVVIGFYGDKILQSFFLGNEDVENIINPNPEDILSINITPDNNDYIKVTNIDGIVNIYYDYIPDGRKIKIHNSVTSISTFEEHIVKFYKNYPFETDYIEIHIGETIYIENIGGQLMVNRYYGEDEFELLKSISLPYIEQIIPSTAIFDFVLIKQTPKWLLVDEYCERDDNGNFTGYKIIEYQNVNYFDITTTGVTQDLIDLIKEDFGEGYVYDGSIIKSTIMLNEYGIPIIMENGNYSFTENNTDYGFDNIYRFKKQSSECGLNTNAVWIVDENLISD